jgi:hypothetical protein
MEKWNEMGRDVLSVQDFLSIIRGLDDGGAVKARLNL